MTIDTSQPMYCPHEDHCPDGCRGCQPTTDWREGRDQEIHAAVAELREIGEAMTKTTATLAEWRRARDDKILKALRAWSRAELSYSQIATLVCCTTERVRQIGAENGL